MSVEALVNEGKKMRWLSGDGKTVSTTPCAFYEQLEIYRDSIDGDIRND